MIILSQKQCRLFQKSEVAQIVLIRPIVAAAAPIRRTNIHPWLVGGQIMQRTECVVPVAENFKFNRMFAARYITRCQLIRRKSYVAHLFAVNEHLDKSAPVKRNSKSYIRRCVKLKFCAIFKITAVKRISPVYNGAVIMLGGFFCYAYMISDTFAAEISEYKAVFQISANSERNRYLKCVLTAFIGGSGRVTMFLST